MTPQDLPEGSVWGVAASFVAAILWIRKKLSKDNVEVKKDSAEIEIITTLQKERDQLKEELKAATEREAEAWRSRADDAKMIGRLEAQVEAMRSELHQLRDDLHVYRLLLDKHGIKGIEDGGSNG